MQRASRIAAGRPVLVACAVALAALVSLALGAGPLGYAVGALPALLAWVHAITVLLRTGRSRPRRGERLMWRVVAGAGILDATLVVGAGVLVAGGDAGPGTGLAAVLLVVVVVVQALAVGSVLLLGGEGADGPLARVRLDLALGILVAAVLGLVAAGLLPADLRSGPGLGSGLARAWALAAVATSVLALAIAAVVQRSRVGRLIVITFAAYAGFQVAGLVLAGALGVAGVGPAFAVLAVGALVCASIARDIDARPVLVLRDRVLLVPALAVLGGVLVLGLDRAGVPGLPVAVPAALALLVLAALRFAVLARDAAGTERARREARTDHLTGLGNRRAMSEELPDLVAEHVGGRLVVVDLDRFKAVNDLAGHAAGDAVLREVGDLIDRTGVRSAAGSWRSGGDEFVLLLRTRDDDVVGHLAEARLPLGAEVDGRTAVTLSVGAADVRDLPADGHDLGRADGDVRVNRARELLRRADDEMYRSKARRLPERRGAQRPRHHVGA